MKRYDHPHILFFRIAADSYPVAPRLVDSNMTEANPSHPNPDGSGDKVLPSPEAVAAESLNDIIQVSADTDGDEMSTGRKSFWGKTRDGLSNASTRVSTTGFSLASKAASLGNLGAAKTAELGKQTYAAAGSAVEAGKQAYVGSGLATAVNYVDGQLEELGAKQAISSTAGAVVGKLDEVTGKRLVELLEKKLQKQDAYNDVLATRLAEALDRISVLENRVHELTPRTEVVSISVTEVR